jgi:hypothetical protein
MGILASGLAAQDSAQTSPPPAAKPAKKAPAPALRAIPKDAVETTPGFYRWTDKNGKVWTYRQTPFGVSRWPADSVDTRQSAVDKRNAGDQRTTAVEEGDSIRFEQATPFGKRTWVRKKTELNETEQRLWDLQQKNSTASRTAEKE